MTTRIGKASTVTRSFVTDAEADGSTVETTVFLKVSFSSSGRGRVGLSLCCRVFWCQTKELLLKGRLSTVDLLFKVGCFVKKNNIVSA
jgi:hypothetical protein